MSKFLFIAVITVLVCPCVVAAQTKPPRALWVWDSSPLLRDARERESFLDFCERHDIGFVWVQIATHAVQADRSLDGATEWKALLADVHRRGMKLHALDGDPQYTLRARHETVLSMVDAVIAYNASALPAERFDGIHLDIEPYLLRAWSDQSARKQLLADYLDLNDRVVSRSHANGLAYGVDVPFWWPSIGDATDHLLRTVDIVGIMDYRTVADGPDGIIAHALDTIERADRIDKARVFVGVETVGLSDSVPSKVTFAGKSLAQMNGELGATEAALVDRRSYAGIAIHFYTTFRQIAESPY